MCKISFFVFIYKSESLETVFISRKLATYGTLIQQTTWLFERPVSLGFLLTSVNSCVNNENRID